MQFVVCSAWYAVRGMQCSAQERPHNQGPLHAVVNIILPYHRMTLMVYMAHEICISNISLFISLTPYC